MLEKTKMKQLNFPSSVFAVWVGYLAVRALWLQSRAILNYGWSGVGNPIHGVFVVSLLLIGLAVAFLVLSSRGNRRALGVFGVLATLVMAPPIFAGSRQKLDFFGYNYYAIFEWIASTWTQLALLVLATFSIFGLMRQRMTGAFSRSDETRENVDVARIRAETVYWVVLVWFVVTVLNMSGLLGYQIWPITMNEFEDFSVRSLRISAVLALPIALVIALWFRSGAALWLLAVNLVAYDLYQLFEWGSYWPEDGLSLYSPSRDFYLEHPLLRLAELAAVLWLVRIGLLRKP